MEFWDMDDRRENRHRSGPGRGSDFVSGIDNEALDFSQLEDFINSEGSQSTNPYFNESLNSTPPSGKLLNVIVENKRNAGHSLPESPPDSSSEHPYSPQEGCEPLNPSENIYTTLGPNIYKPVIGPMLGDNLILGSHIVVAEQNGIMQDTGLMIPEDSNQNFTDRGIYKGDENLVHLGYTPAIENNLCEPNLDNIQTVYTNLQSAPKKRKLSQDSPLVKSEPENCTTSQLSPPGPLSTPLDEEYASSEACLSESQYQCIRFSPFQQPQWHALCDQSLTELPVPHYRVDADKGFNFSNADDAFVCQKKNHFQITCHVQLLGDAQFVKTPDGFQKISSFHLHFYGVKHDCPTQTIRVEQSQSDRSKKPFHPVLVELVNSQVTKVTVGRLHFSETTSNNMRKKGKPNPEQRYFQLVVGLHAHTTNGNFPVISHASQKIIVRASNPGQFESDVELCWQKGQTQDSIFHNGKVGINTDRPDESLVVHGNIKVTGHIIQPSDIRAKKNIVECDTAEQLRNVQKLRVVRYDYEPSFASQLSRDSQHSDTGVIAQEVAKILPEAVRPAGDLVLKNGQSIDNFLVVNKERIFMENIGAVKELCKVTDNLETRIDQLERINRRLNKLKRGDSLKSTSTVSSLKHSNSMQKCSKHHCDRDDELCSNKFIQIIIVILVLIMAFCLAAITTLYLMEASRHNQFVRTNLQQTHRSSIVTKRQMKVPKNHQSRHTEYHKTSNNNYKDDDVTRITIDPSLTKRPSAIIGRPPDCLSVDQDLESSHLCQIYCCAATQPPVIPPPESPNSIYGDKSTNRTVLNLEQAKLATPFHSTTNEIDKRQKRDAYDLTGEISSFDMPDDQIFLIIVQGRNFNTTLTHKYLIAQPEPHNYSYSVPISKYMPDEFINLIFRSTQESIKEVEYCNNNYKERGCAFEKPQTRHKVNEHSPSQLISTQSVIFEVNMADFQSKIMTYRASSRANQNTCKLSNLDEFIEYNFHFYRHCDE
ncbi:myelin regulatory factor isoform X2 [Tribolium castaneum]|uniref:myelin regulatory factor isoform X2 n=1 Tax=Tribolium castaneum TaxID=7070 RepID=UPI00046BEECD|nr:PREDICTED: myelin regulatory factor isoform X2 [Tribolium castaneum]|eukprot:XP_008194461.1 PREDICTED: myelin regulatory factor isoform X2 [Tribolium castaneum]